MPSNESASSTGSAGMVSSVSSDSTSMPSGCKIARTSSSLCGLPVASRICMARPEYALRHGACGLVHRDHWGRHRYRCSNCEGLRRSGHVGAHRRTSDRTSETGCGSHWGQRGRLQHAGTGCDGYRPRRASARYGPVGVWKRARRVCQRGLWGWISPGIAPAWTSCGPFSRSTSSRRNGCWQRQPDGGWLPSSPDTCLACSSCVAKFALPYFGAYAATKGAQDLFCQAMRVELAPAGIHVSTVHPITTTTEFFDVSAQVSARTDHPTGLHHTPRTFRQSPDRVGRAVVRCLRRPRPEVWTSRMARIMAALRGVCPRLMDRQFRSMLDSSRL